MKLTLKQTTLALLFIIAFGFGGKAQCPDPAVLTLIAEDTNQVFNIGQGTSNTISSPYSCSSMAFVIYPTSTNTTSSGIAQPCIRSRYNPYYTNVRNNGTESIYENSGLIFTLAPGNPAANRIGGATPPTSGSSLWDFSLYQLDPTLTHSVSICKTGGGAMTADSISVRDCWRNAASYVYASAAAWNSGCGIAWNDPVNSGHLGTGAWSISPAAVWPAVYTFNSGLYYVDPLYLPPATYTVTYIFTPPSGTPACTPVTLTYTFTVAAPSAATYNPNWTTINLCSAAACANLNSQVTGTSGGDWAGTGVSGNQFCPSVSGVGNFAVTYTVGPSDVCGNSQTHTISVTATPTLGLTTPSTQSMCLGGSVNLGVSGANTYTWAPAGSLNNANSATPTATPGSSTVYTVTGTSASGCVGTSTTVSVTVNNPPTMGVGAANYTVCSGGTVAISATGASTYTWSPAGSLDNPNSATPNATPGGTTVYTVSGTSAAGCPSTSSATTAVTVNTPATLTVSPSASFTVCPGGTVGMSVSGASTYTWSPAGSLNNANSATPNATPSGTTIYTVSGTDASGCPAVAGATATVTVNTPVTLTVSPSASYTVCPGGTVGMSVSGASTYTWSPAGSLDNANSATPNATPGGTTIYTVSGTDASGCAAVAGTTATVTVNTPVTLTVSPGANFTVCPGGTVGMSVSGASTYTWSPAGSLDNANSATPNATPGSTTVYTVNATDASGCAAVAGTTATVTVNTPGTITANSNPASLCTGSTATLTASGGSTYTWSANAGSLTTNTVSITPSATDTYVVSGLDANGCTAVSGTVIVAVGAALTPTITATTSSLCSGQTATLTATGATTYTWLPGGSTATTITVSPTGNTTYTLTGDNSGCAGTTSMTLSVTTTPTVSTSGSAPSICSGSSATLTASGATNYTWMPGSVTTNTVSVTPGSTQVYTVTGESGGCTSGVATITVSVTTTPTVSATAASSGTVCAGQNITLTGSGATTYTWMPGSLTGSVTTVNPSSNVTYTLTGANGACTATTTVSVTTVSVPSLTVTPSANSICSGDPPVTISASGASGYVWSSNAGNATTNTVSVSPGSTSTYTVVGTSAGCSDSTTVTINVTATPTVTITSSTTNSVCSGSSTTISASGATSYVWMPGGALTGSAIVSPTVTTTYTVTGANGNCTQSQTTTVTVSSSPTISAMGTPDSARCGNLSGSISSITVVGGTAPVTYQWYNTATGTAISGATGASLSGVGAGSYNVVVTDGLGCTTTNAGAVVVPGSPAIVASIGPGSSQGQAPLNVSFTNNTIGASAYSWNFGTGNFSSQAAPGETFNTPGTYTVVMTATNGTCLGRDTVYVIVDVATTIVIPNIFSPNGDNINDVFTIISTGMKTLNCDIFNRWGTKMFTITAPTQSWDGKTSNGADATEGTYYYILSGQGYDGKAYTREGPLTLVK